MIVSAFRDKYDLAENINRHDKLKTVLREKNLGFFELIGYWDEAIAPPWDEKKDYNFEFEDDGVDGETLLKDVSTDPKFVRTPQYRNKMARDMDKAIQTHIDIKKSPEYFRGWWKKKIDDMEKGSNFRDLIYKMSKDDFVNMPSPYIRPTVEYSLFIPYNPKAGFSYSSFLKIGVELAKEGWFDQQSIIFMDRKKNTISMLSGGEYAHSFGEVSFKNISHAYSRLHSDINKSFLFEGVHFTDHNAGRMHGHMQGYIMKENEYFLELFKSMYKVEPTPIPNTKNKIKEVYQNIGTTLKACWARLDSSYPNGIQIIDVPSGFHIEKIWESPEDFGTTKEELEQLYLKHGEKKRTEGAAREEAIINSFQMGWLRVRHYIGKMDYWSLQCDDTMKRKKLLTTFCYAAIQNKWMTLNDDVVMLGFNEKGDRQDYRYSDGGIERFLSKDMANELRSKMGKKLSTTEPTGFSAYEGKRKK